LHRKGATPAKSMQDARVAWLGQPVVVPGSMGARSYLLSGHGNTSALESASHGAGRVLSRGKAARIAEHAEGLARLRVVTPIDPEAHTMKRRPEVLEKLRKRLSEEAPAAYKDIEPVVDSLVSADVAHRVASLVPLVTVKG
jgi:tRNA-splicing ligase RtcB